MSGKNGNGGLTVAMISEHGDPIAPLGGQQSGGQNVYVYEVARALSKLGVKVDVFTRWENRKAAKVVRFATRAKVIRLKAGPRHFISKDKFGPLMPEFVERVLEYARLNKRCYNIIHTHYYYSGWAGLQLKHILGKKLVHIFHSLGLIKHKALAENDPSPKERTQIEKKLMRSADMIISTSPQEKLDMVREYGVSGKNVAVIPAGVNLRRFTPLGKASARRKLKLPQDKKIVVFAGKMEKRKGGETLIKAVKEIQKNCLKIYSQLAVYMFSGDPRIQRKKEKKETTTRHALKDMIRDLEVDDTVKLMPGIEQDKLHYYYGAADVVVMPSYYEPFGMVAVEALATGTPVVASNVGGLKWTIQDGVTGFHARAKSAKGFAKQIVRILNDPVLERKMSRNGIEQARKNYAWLKIAKKTLAIYKQLIAKDAGKTQ